MKVCVLAAAALAGLAAPVHAEMFCTTADNVTSCEAEGNLAPSQNRGCIAIGDADTTMSPADLAVSVVACAKANREKDAAGLLVLMLARGRFDMDRVVDQTAHQAIQVMQMNIGAQLTPEQAKGLEDVLHGWVDDTGSPAFAGLCDQIAKLGVPGHDPSYMIAHGINAVTGDGDDGLVSGFDAAAAWDNALHTYLKCPK